MSALDSQRLNEAFQARPDIIQGIKRASGTSSRDGHFAPAQANQRRQTDSPGRIALFNEIAKHVCDRLQGGDEPAQKKRKVNADQTNGAAPAKNGGSTAANVADEPILLEVKEISVSVPQRKKFEICLTPSYLYARAPGSKDPLPVITYAWEDIGMASDLVRLTGPLLT